MLGAGHASKMLTSVARPSDPMIHAKSPTTRFGPALAGAMVGEITPLVSTGGGGTAGGTKLTSLGSAPACSTMPGVLTVGLRGGVDGSPSGKQPSWRASTAGSSGTPEASSGWV